MTTSELNGLLGMLRISKRALAGEIGIHPVYVRQIVAGTRQGPRNFLERAENAVARIIERRRVQLAEVRRMEHAGTK